jgi:hypothetical protein
LFILPEALMSDTNTTIPNCQPSNPNGRVEKDGYKAGFYPGFISRLAVRDATGVETELYLQSQVFCLPPGSQKPWPMSTLEFTRPDGRRIMLQVDDPDQQIERIEVRLRGTSTPLVRQELVDHVQKTSGTVLKNIQPTAPSAGEGDTPSTGEGDDGVVLICEDGPVLCPPICPDGT